MTIGEFDEEHNPHGAALAYHYVVPCGKLELVVKVRATSERQALQDVQRWLDDSYPLVMGFSGSVIERLGGVGGGDLIHGGPPSIESVSVNVREGHRVIVQENHLEEAFP